MNGHTRVWRSVAVVAALVSMAVPVEAQQKQWVGAFAGTSEVPPNSSPATGWADVFLSGHFLTVNVMWQGLIGGNPTAAHIHCCAAPGSNAGVAIGLPGFPVTTSGTYSTIFDLTNSAIYGAAFRSANGGTAAGAEAALIAGLDAGKGYLNIHNARFPGGEVRANVVATPEPASMALVATGLVAFIGAGWRRRRTA